MTQQGLSQQHSVGSVSGLAVHQRINRQKRRSMELLNAVRQLDVVADPSAYQQIMNWIRADYEARQGGTIMGLFAQCFLGAPYVDHRLDLMGSICEHFSRGDSVPMPYAQARGLAQSGAYAHIELYTDGAMVPILPDGTAVEL
ncbi:hypothetical protein ACFQNE_05760 [Gordonia phosphorivorans]|uniref:Uncharacterized protein n=1 Tax=Gordonia phosphorivorans TaxID=1056982 RepID=A0ABV6H526_9ACTN